MHVELERSVPPILNFGRSIRIFTTAKAMGPLHRGTQYNTHKIAWDTGCNYVWPWSTCYTHCCTLVIFLTGNISGTYINTGIVAPRTAKQTKRYMDWVRSSCLCFSPFLCVPFLLKLVLELCRWLCVNIARVFLWTTLWESSGNTVRSSSWKWYGH